MKNSTDGPTDLSDIAIIGSGPTALFLTKYLYDNLKDLKSGLRKITIFEKEKILGMGMPYHPETTDIYNLANISSEEIPLLINTFGDWLREQENDFLKEVNITNLPIDDSKVYSRVALGHYFASQFRQLIALLESENITVLQKTESKVIDLVQNKKGLKLIDAKNNSYQFTTVIIANGHEWNDEDKPKSGYFASPWPIQKLIPKADNFYNFTVGILGASLSAFDVVTSLAHRHGRFNRVNNILKFKKNTLNPHFKLVLHSAEGWLPHLQYEQKEPIREIYRHFHRQDLLKLIDDNGFLKLENYFNILCRPALISAFKKDNLNDISEKLLDQSFSFKDWVSLMSGRHEYVDSFEGMKKELETARRSINKNIPIHWMETLDDLMYTLNYHAELLPAEDHEFFHSEIMTFLMNVIAALPLQSAEILLALYDADAIELKKGHVNFDENSFDSNLTKISVKDPSGNSTEFEYNLFVNCGGEKKLEISDYPFPTIVNQGIVCTAKAKFAEEDKTKSYNDENIISTEDGFELQLSGIEVDAAYRTINEYGTANNFLYDINFTHTSGLRPYSYGLQACSATSLIVVQNWLAEMRNKDSINTKIEKITALYEESEGL